MYIDIARYDNSKYILIICFLYFTKYKNCKHTIIVDKKNKNIL